MSAMCGGFGQERWAAGILRLLRTLFAAILFPPLANEFAESKCEKIIKNPCKIKGFSL